MMTINRALLRSAAVLLALAFAGCTESPSTPLAPADREISAGSLQLVQQPLAMLSLLAQAEIGPEGGTLHIPGGHTLVFPAGALSTTTTISASRDPSSVAVEFGPAGLVFPSDARPTLTYHFGAITLPPWVQPGALRILYVDGKFVEVLDTHLDLVAQTIEADLGHFSTYVLATD